MLTRIKSCIDSLEILYDVNDEVLKGDEKLFNSLKPKFDPDLVSQDEYASFKDVLLVLSRPLHFKNLFQFYKAVYFIVNARHLTTLKLTIDEKKQLQALLLCLYEKMIDVYKKKINSENGWWEDEGGIIQGSIYRMKSRIENMFTKYVIHIPHSGLEIPKKYRDDYFLDDEDLQKNIEQYADYKTDKLYRDLTDKHDSVINPYSRLFMDPERFFDDEKESMSTKYGLGWFYENAILEKKTLRQTINKDEISNYYHEHHDKLTSLVEEKLEMFGECIILDCHSFSNERYWFHDKNLELPDICIGYDEFHKSEEVVNILVDGFSDFEVMVNTPYAGSIVPNKYYLKDKRVKSVMIEFNKKLYLEDDNVSVKNRFIPFQSILGRL